MYRYFVSYAVTKGRRTTCTITTDNKILTEHDIEELKEKIKEVKKTPVEHIISFGLLDMPSPEEIGEEEM
jgi:hypothetical protein